MLLSGGVDSATTLAFAKADGFEPYALTFRYGQRHELEVQAARRVAAQLSVVDHVVLDIDLRVFGSSALTDDIPVPKDRSHEEIATGIPVTYVPARNTIFLSFALGWAEVLGACDIFIGVNAVDYSGYPDCREEYIAAFQRMADLATRVGVEEGKRIRIHTPLIRMAKHEIVRAGIGLGVDYSLTMSCYDPAPDGVACGRCDACRLRLRAFAAAGVGDPVRYSAGTEASR